MVCIDSRWLGENVLEIRVKMSEDHTNGRKWAQLPRAFPLPGLRERETETHTNAPQKALDGQYRGRTPTGTGQRP